MFKFRNNKVRQGSAVVEGIPSKLSAQGRSGLPVPEQQLGILVLAEESVLAVQQKNQRGRRIYIMAERSEAMVLRKTGGSKNEVLLRTLKR